MGRYTVFIFILLSVLFILIGSSYRKAGYNLILIDAHGLRADHLSSFGYKRLTSPNIDKMVREGLVFDSLISTSSNFVQNQKEIISYNQDNIVNFLKSGNYKTAAFFDGRRVFEQLKDYPFDAFDNSRVPLLKEKIDIVSSFIAQNKNNKFFILIGSLEIHHPNRLPASFYNKFDSGYSGIAKEVSLLNHWYKLPIGRWQTMIDLLHQEEEHQDHESVKLEEKDIENLVARYDEAIFHFDEFLGELLLALEKNNLDKKTIIVLISDTGLLLFEKGAFAHDGPYEGQVKLLFSIYRPGVKIGKKVESQIIHKDVSPFLINLLGFGQEKIDPESLGYEFIVGATANPLYKCRFVRSQEWKLVECGDRRELFNLINDPGENSNIIKENSDKERELLEKLP